MSHPAGHIGWQEDSSPLFFFVKYLHIFAYTTCVFVFSKHMIYFNYLLYIHQEKLNYILWYIKNTTPPAFCIKLT